MCTPDRPCPVLDFASLRTLALWVTESPDWPGRAVSIGLSRRPGYDGYVLGRVVRFAPQAPACVVTHELAHVLTRTVDHDARFWRTQADVDCLANEVWRSRLAGRGSA
jgi:hypothetical protein